MTQPKPHKHAALIRQWADLVAKGEVAAGWWCCEFFPNDDSEWQRLLSRGPAWELEMMYRIIKTDKHPDNAKPKFDWSKVPVGAMTDFGLIMWNARDQAFCNENGGAHWRPHSLLRLAPMTMWFDGEPTQEQHDMFEIEQANHFDQWLSRITLTPVTMNIEIAPGCKLGKIWRIKGAKNGY